MCDICHIFGISFCTYLTVAFFSFTIKSIVTSPKPSSPRANVLSDYSYPIPVTKQLSRVLPFTNPRSHLCRSLALQPPFTLDVPRTPQNSATPPRKHRLLRTSRISGNSRVSPIGVYLVAKSLSCTR